MSLCSYLYLYEYFTLARGVYFDQIYSLRPHVLSVHTCSLKVLNSGGRSERTFSIARSGERTNWSDPFLDFLVLYDCCRRLSGVLIKELNMRVRELPLIHSMPFCNPALITDRINTVCTIEVSPGRVECGPGRTILNLLAIRAKSSIL